MDRGVSSLGLHISNTVSTLNLRDSVTQQALARSLAQEAAQRFTRRQLPLSPYSAIYSPRTRGESFDDASMKRRSPSPSPARRKGGSSVRSASVSPPAARGADTAPSHVSPHPTVSETDAYEEVAHLRRQVRELEATLSRFVSRFTDACEKGTAGEYYTVTFGLGPIGLILALEEGVVTVAELRSDPYTHVPLLALASGRVAVGDAVIAVNTMPLDRHGSPPTLEDVATQFRRAVRPLQVLFRRAPRRSSEGWRDVPSEGPRTPRDAAGPASLSPGSGGMYASHLPPM